ncbi:MAG: ABC transporter ATP-binding protein/permease [Oculatellaceae cyanobacterium Prado106]|nr:ABC transporter ATP-binding protein/permease [Oculatellaceae cyanobacterium Prado106]
MALFILVSVMEAFGIGLVGPFLWVASNPESLRQVALLDHLYTFVGAPSNEQFILILGLLLVALFCIKSLLYYFARAYIYRFSFHQQGRLITRLLDTYLSVPYTFYLTRDTGSIIKNIIVEAQGFCYRSMLPLLEATANAITTLCLIALLAKADMLLLVMILAVLLPLFLLFYQLRNRVRQWGKDESEAYHGMIQVINHSLGGIKETFVIGCKPYFQEQMDRQVTRYANAASKVLTFQILPRISLETCLIAFLVLFVSVYQIFFQQDSDHLISILSVFAVASIRLMPAASQSLGAIGQIQSGRHALDLLYTDLKTVPQLVKPEAAHRPSVSTQKFFDPFIDPSFNDSPKNQSKNQSKNQFKDQPKDQSEWHSKRHSKDSSPSSRKDSSSSSSRALSKNSVKDSLKRRLRGKAQAPLADAQLADVRAIAPPSPSPTPPTIQSFPFKHSVDLRGVTYHYPGITQNAIEDISLHIPKGQSIAFIGKSGAGKTTLVDVILGLLEATQGDIFVDGQSIYQNVRAWQNLVGYIPQSIFLADESIEKNIAFGVPDDRIDPQRIDQVIHAAQLTELIEHLPEGLKTEVGERGVRLSGGQRQRIGIARALYHEREILVLDEATAALDQETERLVSDAIQSLSGSKTLIIIAHRLSTIQQCDRIYLLERGRIVQAGSYLEVVGEESVVG